MEILYLYGSYNIYMTVMFHVTTSYIPISNSWPSGARSISLEVNLGPVPRKALPFSCHMISSATQADSVQSVSKKGKKECVFPVGLPDTWMKSGNIYH